jgi:hypothetical protein
MEKMSSTKIRPEIGFDETHPFAVYFATVWKIMTHPGKFFASMPVSGGVAAPLAFALITHWLGAAIAFLWSLMIGGAISGYSRGFFKIFGDVADVDHPGRSAMIEQARDQIVHWIWGAGGILADPFLTLVSIAFTSFFVWVGARLLVEPKPERGLPAVSYESALRVVCYGLTPAILKAVPLFGTVLATIAVILVTVVGARETYRIGTGRAIGVALFPQLLWIFTFLGAFMVLALAVVKFVSSVI